MLYVGGQNMLIAQSPTLIDAVTMDTNIYSFDPFIEDLYKGLVAIPDKAREILYGEHLRPGIVLFS